MSYNFVAHPQEPHLVDKDFGWPDFVVSQEHSGLVLPQDIVESKKSAIASTLESPEVMVPKKVRNLEGIPEGSGITKIDEIRQLSDTLPECAERDGFWYYNRPAFDRLVKMWVLRLPSEEQLLAHINAIPGDAVAKAEVMNGKDEPFPGCLDAGNGKVVFRGNSACWWVASSDGSARCGYLNRGNQSANSYSSDPKYGFLVPVLSDNE